MSAMSAEKLREPEQLYSPTSYERQAAEVADALTPEGTKEFAHQVMEAIDHSRDSGNLRPLNNVIESWYRTLVFMSREGFLEKWEETEQTVASAARLSLDDIRKRRAQRGH